MPVVSLFYGLVVYLYFYDNKQHHRPHFHVEFAEYSAVIAIDDGECLEGDLPRGKMKLVQAWLEIHREDIMANWRLALSGQPVHRIKPLE
jgi:Domain of unknown function (DUF4160)